MKDRRPASEMVAIVLAGGIALSLNVITCALLYAAIVRLGIDEDSGISDNGVQILLAWGGGIIGVLGAYVGYTFGKKKSDSDEDVIVEKPAEDDDERPIA